ncbi:hypothetical protein, variant [Sphaeroforma arctica JP610]|uniref:Uncharacterized protein n=1 Tax=Sphaeroforma arctica JP610 TaxID=667725 RepID=A0A0L0FR65_9EUKA|nr:hypothetical protein, variant [Sphaeroforma arctica JP610]KNC79260.1 hypothetical protein, variant [Sphaeroforma arctica JP610]|eukprot:XP_014153162.1 hypothetical protein, variant [Sphaeroforma arctica JP610]
MRSTSNLPQQLKGLRNAFQRPVVQNSSAKLSTSASQGLSVACAPQNTSAHCVRAIATSETIGRRFSTSSISNASVQAGVHNTYINWVLDSLKSWLPSGTSSLFARKGSNDSDSSTANGGHNSPPLPELPVRRRNTAEAHTEPDWQYLTAQQLCDASGENAQPIIFSRENVSEYYRQRSAQSRSDNLNTHSSHRMSHSLGYVITHNVFTSVCTYLFNPVKRLSISAVESTHDTLTHALTCSYSTYYSAENLQTSEQACAYVELCDSVDCCRMA